MFADIMYYARSFRDGAYCRAVDIGALPDSAYSLASHEDAAVLASTLSDVFEVSQSRLYRIFTNAIEGGERLARKGMN
jgi:hypothetical protein